MSDPPAPSKATIQRSDEIHVSRGFLLAVGMWLTIGVFGLYDRVEQWAGANTASAYLAVALVMIPTALSHLELRSWIGRRGGSYRLIQAMERSDLAHVAGWTYVLGWAAISGLMAWFFAEYASLLLETLTPWTVPGWALVLGLLLFFTTVNVLGCRLSWNLSVALMAGATLAVALLVLRLAIHAATSEPTRYGVAPPGNDFYGAVVLLVSATWVVELTVRQGRRANLTAGVVALLGGPLLGALLAVSARWAEPSMPSLATVAEVASPFTRLVVILGGTLGFAVAWQMVALLMMHELAAIGRDGVFPARLLRTHHRFHTPVVLIVTMSLLTLTMFWLSQPLADPGAAPVLMAQMAAFAFLVVQLGVNLAAIRLADHPRAIGRRVQLPLHPLVPAVGIALCLLMFAGMKLTALAMGVGWIALGVVSYWRAGRDRMRSSQLGLTVFQDTTRRPDITSPFPVVVPVAGRDTDLDLASFAATVARSRGGHVVLVLVLEVPEQLPLGSGRAVASRELEGLDALVEHVEGYGVSAEAVSRLARTMAQGILDTIGEENAQLVVVGWSAEQRPDGRWATSPLVEMISESAACQVAVVRGDWSAGIEQVLVPVAGGPNAPEAAELALTLTKASGGGVTLLNVTRQDDPAALVAGRSLLEETRAVLSEADRARNVVNPASSPMAGIREALADHDALLLGATDPGFLDPRSLDPFPLRMAQQTEKPLAVVRGSMTVSRVVARRAWHSLADALPSVSPKEQRELYRRMSDASKPTVNYFVLIILSAMIATLGLLLNSVAVIIGAMLVAPLMDPIVATAAGIAFGNARMLRDGLVTTVQGALLAVFVAIFTSLITPLVAPTAEIMSRTEPTLLDLLVALVSGAAGAYILARKEVGGALPGVAIAAALMPPLCVIGVGLALVRDDIFVGATLLFVANLAAIVLASAVVFLLLGVRPPLQPDREMWMRQGLRLSMISLLVISVPLGFALIQSTIQANLDQTARGVVQKHVLEWQQDGKYSIEVVSFKATRNGLWDVDVDATLYTTRLISNEMAAELESDLDAQLRPDVVLRLFAIPGVEIESDLPATPTPGDGVDQTPTPVDPNLFVWPQPPPTATPPAPTTTPTEDTIVPTGTPAATDGTPGGSPPPDGEATSDTPAPGPPTRTPEQEPVTDTPRPGPATDTPEPEPTAETPEPGPATDTPEPEPTTDTPEPGAATDTPEPAPEPDTPEQSETSTRASAG